MPNVHDVVMILLMILGFGFVVFFHEMGHFLAAKWVGIKVEQFAVGFGQALLAWRKGIGVRWGSTQDEYLCRLEAHLGAPANDNGSSAEKPEYTDTQLARAAEELGLGETEYRLNWVPLGGYVKMLGQDDLKANAGVDDPRAYNRKSVGARMVVVSAGVIMNVILAAIGFMVLFMIGFNAPPSVVGDVLTDSPAQRAGLTVGSRILSIDGKTQHDFTKITLTTALLHGGEAVPIEFQLPGSKQVVKSTITAERMDANPKSFLTLGIRASSELLGIDDRDGTWAADSAEGEYSADALKIKPGDTIVAINGEKVEVAPPGPNRRPSDDYYKFDQALQASDGQPVILTVRDAAGKERNESVTPQLERPFGLHKLNFAGMQPRPVVEALPENSSAKGKLHPGDVFVSIELHDADRHPTLEVIPALASQAYEEDKSLVIAVERAGVPQPVEVTVAPKSKIPGQKRGLGIGLGYEECKTVVSDVLPDSAAARAGIRPGSKLTQVDGKPVENWFQVRTLLAQAAGEHKITLLPPSNAQPAATSPAAKTGAAPEAKTVVLSLSADDVQELKNIRATHALALHELIEPRIATGPLQAASWGVTETRDFILQFYLTLKRMAQGQVSASNMMGPLGIVQAGAKFATKGTDWLIWFLAMISANLAVVNFLPIPIVDGGLFMFLIIEKIQRRPLSQRTQAVAQIVGFAVIISVFLLVTYQDIARMFR